MCSCFVLPIPKSKCLLISYGGAKGTLEARGEGSLEGTSLQSSKLHIFAPLTNHSYATKISILLSLGLTVNLNFLVWVWITYKCELLCGPKWYKIIYEKSRDSKAYFKRKFIFTPLRHLCEHSWHLVVKNWEMEYLRNRK